MSLVSAGYHYIRDGLGAEELFDLTIDRAETVNLIAGGRGSQLVRPLRQSLLDVLDANPGAIQSENAYLKAYRQWLRSLVGVNVARLLPPL